jgi:hypothetical protein
VWRFFDLKKKKSNGWLVGFGFLKIKSIIKRTAHPGGVFRHILESKNRRFYTWGGNLSAQKEWPILGHLDKIRIKEPP